MSLVAWVRRTLGMRERELAEPCVLPAQQANSPLKMVDSGTPTVATYRQISSELRPSIRGAPRGLGNFRNLG
jgi:hypothetical protein